MVEYLKRLKELLAPMWPEKESAQRPERPAAFDPSLYRKDRLLYPEPTDVCWGDD